MEGHGLIRTRSSILTCLKAIDIELTIDEVIIQIIIFIVVIILLILTTQVCGDIGQGEFGLDG